MLLVILLAWLAPRESSAFLAPLLGKELDPRGLGEAGGGGGRVPLEVNAAEMYPLSLIKSLEDHGAGCFRGVRARG